MLPELNTANFSRNTHSNRPKKLVCVFYGGKNEIDCLPKGRTSNDILIIAKEFFSFLGNFLNKNLKQRNDCTDIMDLILGKLNDANKIPEFLVVPTITKKCLVDQKKVTKFRLVEKKQKLALTDLVNLSS